MKRDENQKKLIIKQIMIECMKKPDWDLDKTMKKTTNDIRQCKSC